MLRYDPFSPSPSDELYLVDLWLSYRKVLRYVQILTSWMFAPRTIRVQLFYNIGTLAKPDGMIAASGMQNSVGGAKLDILAPIQNWRH